MAPDLVDRRKRGMPVEKRFATRLEASRGREELEKYATSVEDGGPCGLKHEERAGDG